jgi:hypothetical protein
MHTKNITSGVFENIPGWPPTESMDCAHTMAARTRDVWPDDVLVAVLK